MRVVLQATPLRLVYHSLIVPQSPPHHPLTVQAAEIVDNEDRSRQAIEYLGKAARLLVRQQQYEEALKIITREIDAHLSVSHYVHSCVLH